MQVCLRELAAPDEKGVLHAAAEATEPPAIPGLRGVLVRDARLGAHIQENKLDWDENNWEID